MTLKGVVEGGEYQVCLDVSKVPKVINWPLAKMDSTH